MLTIPEGLAPEVYPLAWLVGTWRGFGAVGYEGVPERNIVHEIDVDHDGGPFLRWRSTLWDIDADASAAVNQEMTGTQGYESLTKANVWTQDTAYWRPVAHTGTGDGAETPSDTTASDGEGTPLEVVVADPAGWLSLYVGHVQGPRVNLVTDAVVRTGTAPEITGATLMYGLVQSDLLWAQDLAAFGQPLSTYASGRLTRIS